MVSPFLLFDPLTELRMRGHCTSCIPTVIICSPKDKNSSLIRYLLYRFLQVKISKTTERSTVRHLLISTLQYYRTKPVQSMDTNRQQSGHSELLTDYHHRVLLEKNAYSGRDPHLLYCRVIWVQPSTPSPFLSLSNYSLLPRCIPGQNLLP